MPVRIVTDSACDLPDAVVEELGIEIVPLTIRFGSEELVDRVELSNQAFWQRLATATTLPETAAPSAGSFAARFRALADAGADGVVCINLSSRLSATMQAAQVAAPSVADACRVEVIDSLTCSMGLGNLCIAAAKRAASGAPIDEIVDEVISRRDRTRLFGTLDTLEFLKKGGRIGNARALLGSMLAVKPVVEVRDGVVDEAGKVRTRSKALRLLADKVHEQSVEDVAVLQGDASDIDEFLDLIDDVAPRDKIVVGAVGPVIGTHAGPGVLGVTYQTAD
ncbi:MAG TPA: DegV family protein [Acidimicrobiia bacterium]|nr:DegV family protein [Acidimicrobiia bacterium]